MRDSRNSNGGLPAMRVISAARNLAVCKKNLDRTESSVRAIAKELHAAMEPLLKEKVPSEEEIYDYIDKLSDIFPGS